MKKIIIFSMLSVMLLSGCKDFLSQESQHRFFPKTTDDLIEMIAGEADYDGAVKGVDAIYTLLTDQMDDDITCSGVRTDEGYPDNTMTRLPYNKSIYTWQYDLYDQMDEAKNNNVNSGFAIPPDYRQYYELYVRISACNVALDWVDKVTGPAREKSQIRAEASALRALYYFLLVNLYGQPYTHDKDAMGVPLKIRAGYQEKEIKRSTVGEVYSQILADMDAAETAFNSMDEENRYIQNGRINLPALQLLRSRVCLYMGNWEESAKYAQYLIENTTYTLKDFSNVSQTVIDAAIGGTITGFRSMLNNGEFDPKNDEVIWSFGNQRGSDLTNANHIGLLYGNGNVSTANPRRRFQFIASSGLVSSYQDGDRRKIFYLVRVNPAAAPAAATEYGPYAKVPVVDFFPLDNKKYPAYSFRLAEAYLNKAEALAMMSVEGADRAAEALETVNILRRTRFAPDSEFTELKPVTGEALVKEIWKERRRELNFEGHRWFDLRRQGMPPIEHEWRENGVSMGTFVLLEKDNAYTLPIPPDALKSNWALKQNPLGPVRVAQ